MKSRTTKELAEALATELNAEGKYPRESVRVGGGRHVAPELARTERAVSVVLDDDGVHAIVDADDTQIQRASSTVREALVAGEIRVAPTPIEEDKAP